MQMITQSRTGTGKSTSWKKNFGKYGLTLIDWFDSKQMQANPDKFQANAVGVKPFEQGKHFTLASVDILSCEENVKLLDVELDLKNSEYDQEIPQPQTADNPMALRGIAAQPSRDTRKTN